MSKHHSRKSKTKESPRVNSNDTEEINIIVLSGENAGVGKSTFCHRYCKEEYIETIEPTISISFKKQITFHPRTTIDNNNNNNNENQSSILDNNNNDNNNNTRITITTMNPKEQEQKRKSKEQQQHPPINIIIGNNQNNYDKDLLLFNNNNNSFDSNNTGSNFEFNLNNNNTNNSQHSIASDVAAVLTSTYVNNNNNQNNIGSVSTNNDNNTEEDEENNSLKLQQKSSEDESATTLDHQLTNNTNNNSLVEHNVTSNSTTASTSTVEIMKTNSSIIQSTTTTNNTNEQHINNNEKNNETLPTTTTTISNITLTLNIEDFMSPYILDLIQNDEVVDFSASNSNLEEDCFLNFRKKQLEHYSKMDAFLICFDTFDEDWLSYVYYELDLIKEAFKENEEGLDFKVIYLVLMKCDLNRSKEQEEQIKKLLEDTKLPFIRTSSKENLNVNVCFENLIKMVVELKAKEPIKRFKKKASKFAMMKDTLLNHHHHDGDRKCLIQ
ncbi:hypothetical protein ABK040_005082 [Willaertia magna]